MQRIAVCSNSAQDRSALVLMLSRRFRELCADIIISEYEISAEFMTESARKDFLFVFLDADTQEYSGLELARDLRESGFLYPVIFFSGSNEPALNCFTVHPAGFMVKPFDYSQLCAILDWNRNMLTDALRSVDVISSRISLKIFLVDIICIEVQGRSCFIRTTCGQFKTNQSLSGFIEQLEDAPFLRCHRSFLVNINYISKLDELELHMTDGSAVPVSAESGNSIRRALASLKG